MAIDEAFYIPTLHTFAMNNGFTGSYEMRTPKEVDFEASSIRAEYWHGPLCYEKSEIQDEKTFPMSEAGRTALRTWLWENR